MAKLGSPKGFWDIIKSVSVAQIAKEANRPLSVAIIGSPERRQEATQMLFADDTPGHPDAPTKARALPEPPFVQGFEAMTEEAQFPRQTGVFDLVIDVGGGREGAPEGTRIYAVAELDGWENTLDRILEDRPELALPLARNFPVFRRKVALRIISQTAIANAQFALVTGVAEALPITAILLPVNSLSDIVILTKNQVMMILRLAAAYGLPVDYKSRTKEVAPILANAFGWRAVARELVGVVPFIGFLPRAMIAYAGTVTVGKAAQLYYETGETVTSSQARRLYREAYEASRERVRALAESLRSGKGGGGGHRRRLPASSSNGALHPSEEIASETPALPESTEAS
jgi:uncharacterized protein (DUF697 family)